MDIFELIFISMKTIFSFLFFFCVLHCMASQTTGDTTHVNFNSSSAFMVNASSTQYLQIHHIPTDSNSLITVQSSKGEVITNLNYSHQTITINMNDFKEKYYSLTIVNNNKILFSKRIIIQQ
jgi:hypothetical protein